MSWSTPPGAYGSAEPLFLLLIALAVEAYVGNRFIRGRWSPNPRRAVYALVAELERRLNRPQRGAFDRRVRGALVAGLLGLFAFGAGWLTALLTRYYPFAWLVEVLLLVLLVVQRATWQAGARVREALAAGSVIRAREALRPLAGGRLDAAALDRLDAGEVLREALGGIGRGFAERLVGPVFWYVLLGLPGLFLQQAASVMDAALASRGPFGEAPTALDRGLLVPARYLAGLILTAAAAFVPGTNPRAVLAGALIGRAGPPALLAGALARAPEHARLGRALAVFAVACLIDAGLVALVALVRLSVRA